MFTATEEGGQLKHVTTLPHFWVEIIVVVSVIINHCITMITMIVIVIINYCHCHHKSSSLSSYIIVIVMITRWHRWLVLTSQATAWFSPTSRRAGDTSHHLYHLYHGRHSHRHYRHHCYHRHHHCHHHNHRHTIFEDNDEGSLQVGHFRKPETKSWIEYLASNPNIHCRLSLQVSRSDQTEIVRCKWFQKSKIKYQIRLKLSVKQH